MKQLEISDIEEIRNTVLECGELTDGIRSLMNEDGCTGADGLWHICKVLYELSEQLTNMMQGGDDSE